MAEISFSTSNPFINGKIVWSAASNGSAANSSKVTIAVYFIRTNVGYVSYGTLNTHVTCNGATQDENGLYVEITEHGWTLAFVKDYTVKHNDDGTKSCSISVSGDSNFNFSFSKTASITLPKIPRYTSISTWRVASKTDKTITFSWATADNISKIVCYFNGVAKYTNSTLNSKSGSFTVSSLTEHTTYSNITITVYRKDSGQPKPSSALSVTTNYTAPTSKLAFKSSTINSMVLSWSSNFACDAVWLYNSGTQIFSASNVNATSGTITLTPSNWSSISHGKSYSLTIKVRRKASQATATSAAIAASTLAAPVINSNTATSFNIGNSIRINLSNYSNNGSTLTFQYYSKTGSWTKLTEISVAKGVSYKDITPDANTLYSHCPNANALATKIICTTSANGVTYKSERNITANVTSASNPTINDFSFETNVDNNINSVISGTTNLLTGVGNLRLNFAANSATSKHSSTISKLEAKVLYNNTVITSKNIDYKSTAFNYLISTTNFTNAGTYTIQINALDSRNRRSTVISKTLTAYAYHKPALSIKMNRQNEFDEKTYLELNGEISKVTISGTQKNNVVSLQYRMAESGTSFPTTYTTLTGYTPTSGSTDNLLISLLKNTDSNFFATLSSEKSYVYQFIFTDNLFTSDVYEVFVPQGKPAFAAFDDGYAVVDKTPNFDSPAKFQVGSDIMATDASGREVLLLSKINDLISQVGTFLNKVYPVGSIYMSVNSTNPSTLFGGTWALWGSGRVPVSVNTSDTNYNLPEKTGGSSSVNLAHTHTVANHSHGMSHTHTVNSHAHTTAGHALTVAQMPAHSHFVQTSWTKGGGTPVKIAGAEKGENYNGTSNYTGSQGSGSAHSHGNTGNSSPATNTGTKTSTDNSSPATTSSLSSSVSLLQPYITCYMWKRTA